MAREYLTLALGAVYERFAVGDHQVRRPRRALCTSVTPGSGRFGRLVWLTVSGKPDKRKRSWSDALRSDEWRHVGHLREVPAKKRGKRG